jgi:hypothetical protein
LHSQDYLTSAQKEDVFGIDQTNSIIRQVNDKMAMLEDSAAGKELLEKHLTLSENILSDLYQRFGPGLNLSASKPQIADEASSEDRNPLHADAEKEGSKNAAKISIELSKANHEALRAENNTKRVAHLKEARSAEEKLYLA